MKKLEYSSFLNLATVIVTFGTVSLTYQPVTAQITPDDTLDDENSQVTPISDQERQIDGGAIRSSNLFHSFSEFNVGENQTVNFANPENIANIFSRVTGNNLSQILGDLGVLGNANLFLMNPNGIVFGENASLNVNGSFVATTANSINFTDGNKFTANPATGTPLLTINLPNALDFGGEPGTIVNRAQSPQKALSNVQFNNSGSPAGLLVQPEKTLALIGGDVVFEGGNLTATGGKIEVGSVGANSVVRLSLTESQITFDYQTVTNFRNVTLTNRDGFGIGFTFNENGEIVLDENGQPVITFLETTVASFLDASTVAKAGSINIQGKNIDILNGSQLQTFTSADLSGGNISLNAIEQITLSGNNVVPGNVFPSAIASFTASSGDAGHITINTSKLLVQNTAVIASEATETFNPITDELVPSEGNAGTIQINAESVSLTAKGKINSGTSGKGNGGSINISSPQVSLDSESLITTNTFLTGNAGMIDITASDSVTLSNDSQISSTAEENSVGDAGNIDIQAQSVILDENSEILTSTIQSDGGIINLQLEDNLELRNQSLISASVGGNGNGGNINIKTEFIITSPQDNSDITANAELGEGGNISIDASSIFGISFREETTSLSDITVSSSFGTDGTVTLINSEFQPNQIESDSQVQLVKATPNFTPNYCYANRQNQYLQTGRGGVPLAAKSSLVSEYTWEDWRMISSDQAETVRHQNDNSDKTNSSNDEDQPPVKSIQGWMVNQQGEIILTAEPVRGIPHSMETKHPGC